MNKKLKRSVKRVVSGSYIPIKKAKSILSPLIHNLRKTIYYTNFFKIPKLNERNGDFLRKPA